jgi:hypothetical protein
MNATTDIRLNGDNAASHFSLITVDRARFAGSTWGESDVDYSEDNP